MDEDYTVEMDDAEAYEAREAINRGRELMDECRYDDAIEEFKRVTNKLPDHAVAHFKLAEAWLMTGNGDEASRELERAARFAPDDLDIRFFLRHIARFNKAPDEVLKDARMAVEKNANDAGAHDRLGTLLLMMDDMKSGRAEVERAVKLAPDKEEYRLDLAYALSSFYEGAALREVKAALRLAPRWLEAWLFLGAFYADLRRLGDAINAYRQALKIYPDNDLLHYLLGDAYFKAFNARNARIEMETAVELNPDNYEARRVLAGLYLVQGLKDKAIEQYEVLVEMEPGVEMVRKKLELLKRG
ncbi:tetratricopeptide repeat protein [Methanocella paludicola]|nr:tetratricopeptide repeat protein [Methanocella paludicola]